ncbi:MAG: cbb3-type cytochrome c oxidase subunit I, partial [Verrucomicrobiota bacterium]
GPADAAVRWPVLFLLAGSILWLLAGSVLAVIAAIKLHTPGFLADCEFLTFGRVYPAALNAFVYGWGVNAGLAVALWLMARLARATLPGGGLLIVAGAFWNLGVKLGVLGILAGWSTSVPWLEMPHQIVPLLLVAYALAAAWVVGALRHGSSPRLYASQWWLLVALFSLPWLWATAEAMLFFGPVRGTVQVLVGAWFVHGFLLLWFVPLALAVIYYLLPKLLGRPIRAYHLTPFGFWAYVVCAGWAGAARLTGAPVPAWTQAVGTVASLLLLVPLGVIAVNVFGTLLDGGLAVLARSNALRFVGLAALFLVLALLRFAGMLVLRDGAELSWFATASDYAVLYGGFSFAVFGAAYYLLPRLVRRAWPFASLIHMHFLCSVLGFVIGVVALSLGGLRQAADLGGGVKFDEVTAHLLPYLQLATVGGILLLVGHLAFAFHFVKLVFCPCVRARAAAAPVPAELLRTAPDLEAAS